MSGFDIRLERVVNATPDAAFKHWVDAEARRRWYAPDDSWTVEAAETDLRVGGAWRVRFGPTPDEMYVEQGVFEDIDPPHRVVYTTVYEFPDGRPSFRTRVTVTFEPRGDRTLLTVLDTGYPSEEQRRAYEAGWPDFLDAFERTLATGSQSALRHHKVRTSVAVSDIARAVEFYEGKLGLSGVVDQHDDSRVYRCGGDTSLHVYVSSGNAGTATATLASWDVADIEQVVDELSAKGVTFERYDDPSLTTNEKGIHELSNGRVAWFKDPDGNTFALEQAGTDR
jgi:uncharacterized protein YndB with AHSA1/START domain/catechol 2,3-dioxygenase-like lactoylglutathione lyase family enzyme